MEAASPPLSFPVSAVQATGPPLRPQGSLPRSLRDGHCGPPLTPGASTAPHHAVAGGQEQSPCPPNRTALTTKIPQNKVSTVTGDCHSAGVHRPAEFNKTHAPAFLAGEAPGAYV